jgi:hypothetical protein
LLVNSPLDPDALAAFDAAWRSRWAEARPLGYELRDTASATWVRFHSLPESKRYADDEAEYAELLSRHFALLTDLGISDEGLYAVTASWSRGPAPIERQRKVVAAFPKAAYWHSFAYDTDDPDDWLWIHLYVSSVDVDAPELSTLLRLVADEKTWGVIIAPPDAEWLYHPYDGGGDVIAPDTVTRDRLREKHSAWLSGHAEGL